MKTYVKGKLNFFTGMSSFSAEKILKYKQIKNINISIPHTLNINNIFTIPLSNKNKHNCDKRLLQHKASCIYMQIT